MNQQTDEANSDEILNQAIPSKGTTQDTMDLADPREKQLATLDREEEEEVDEDSDQEEDEDEDEDEEGEEEEESA